MKMMSVKTACTISMIKWHKAVRQKHIWSHSFCDFVLCYLALYFNSKTRPRKDGFFMVRKRQRLANLWEPLTYLEAHNSKSKKNKTLTHFINDNAVSANKMNSKDKYIKPWWCLSGWLSVWFHCPALLYFLVVCVFRGTWHENNPAALGSQTDAP